MSKEQLTPKRVVTTDRVISDVIEVVKDGDPAPKKEEVTTTINFVNPEEVAMDVGQWVQSQFTTERDRTALGAFEKVMRWRGKPAATAVQFEALYHEFMSES